MTCGEREEEFWQEYLKFLPATVQDNIHAGDRSSISYTKDAFIAGLRTGYEDGNRDGYNEARADYNLKQEKDKHG